MTNNHLICFLGRNGSGKTYRANELVTKEGYIKVAMADAMRELLWGILGWRPESEEEYAEFKNQHSVIFERYKKLVLNFDKEEHTVVNYHSPTKVVTASGRQLLQNIGESCKEMFGQDFWVKEWEKKIEKYIDPISFKEDIIIEISERLQNQFPQNLLLQNINTDIDIKISKTTVDEKGLRELEPEEITFISSNSLEFFAPNEIKDNNVDTILIHPENPILKRKQNILEQTKITTDDVRFPQEIEAARRLGATFIWCDYQKGNYPEDNHPSEALANRILASGKYQDGDEISFEELKKFFEYV